MEQQAKLQLYRKFVDDPDWEVMKQFILEELEPSLDIRSIDMNKDKDVILGDIVARQRIYEIGERLKNRLDGLKSKEEVKLTRRTLK